MGDVEVPALKNVSLTIKEGEFVAIMGASGSGKSTLLHILGLLDKPTSGTYRLVNEEVSKLSDDELASFRNKFLGFIFQSFNLLARVPANENVALPRIYSTNKKFLSDEITLLKKVGLGDRLYHKPNELSGGQMQRVAIARSLINDPFLLCADEPTGNLDSKSTVEIMDIIKELNATGITIIMVTHEPDLAQQAKRIIRLQDGEIIKDERTRNDVSDTGLVNKSHILENKKHSAFNMARVNDYFKQAIRSLLSNKTRSLLSILGVLIGVTCLIAMLALGRGAQEDVKKQMASLGSNILMVTPGSAQRGGVHLEAGSVTRLTIEDSEQVKQIPGVSAVAAYANGNGQVVFGAKNATTRIVGTTPDYVTVKNAAPAVGRFFNEKETIAREKFVVIGKTVKDNLFGSDNPIGEFIKIRKIDFMVIGVLPEKGSSGWRNEDDQVVIPLNTAMYRVMGKEFIDNMDVQVSESGLMDRVTARIKKLIMQLHRLPPEKENSIDVRNMAEIQKTVTGMIQTFSYLLGSIAFISLLVGGIGIMNIMLVSVTERTREIGLRKAIGASNKDIMFQFVIEAIAVCTAGGILGVILGVAISLILSKFAGWSTYVAASPIVIAFGFSFCIGLIFGLWPARKASKLNPIEALRYE
jgi:macrolide transport system ATP-binding/permease protein